MKTIENLIGVRKGETALVICAGATVKEYEKQIKHFIEETNPFTIGINNMTHLFVPDYHLWTNNRRFRTFGKNIKDKPILLLGSNISLKVIKDTIGSRDYIVLNRIDREGVPINYKNGTIYGYHRTAGCTAITVSHLLGAKEINVVGMDGHTRHKYEDVISGIEHHHCYNEDYIPYPKEICMKKDKIVNGVLKSLEKYGMNFKILTPTVYEDYYDSTRLHI